jgi:hypothetical protein
MNGTHVIKIDAAEMVPGKLYAIDQVIGIVKDRTKRGRTMRVLLAADWDDLTEREKERVYRWHNR